MKKMAAVLMMVVSWTTMAAWCQNSQRSVVYNEDGLGFLPNERGRYFVETYYDEGYTASLTASTVQLYEQKMTDIIEAFQRHGLLSPPMGFQAMFNKRIYDTETVFSPPDFPIETESRVVSEVEFAFSPYLYIDGKPAIDFQISNLVQIRLNDVYRMAGSPVMGDIFPCPRPVADFHGIPVYSTNREEVIILNLSGKELFIPVSRENYIHTLIGYWKDKASQYQSDGSAQSNFFTDQIASLKRELSAMSPAERSAPAIYGADASYMNNSGLLPQSDIDQGDMLVRINPELVPPVPDRIAVLSIHWHMMDTEHYDKPRLCSPSRNPAQLADNKVLTLYNDARFWQNLFETMKQPVSGN